MLGCVLIRGLKSKRNEATLSKTNNQTNNKQHQTQQQTSKQANQATHTRNTKQIKQHNII